MSPDLGWLGGRRFWLVAVAVVVFTFSALLLRRHALDRTGAVVPVVTMSGPTEAVAGETARYAVLVRDRSGAPVAGSEVRIGFWRRGLVELASGRTSEGGDATLEVRFPPDFKERRSLVAVASAGVADSTDSLQVSPKAPPVGSVFLSTDKPIYQPGQTVHLRALALAGGKPIADRPVTLLVRTADGIKVFQREVRSSPFGVVTADFDLADQVKLGAYSVHVDYDLGPGPRASNERSFSVERYSLPKVKIALEDVSALTPTGTLRGRARATWIFGEPVTNAAVSVQLVALSTSAIERRVEGRTDRDGVLAFELAPDRGKKASDQPRGAFVLRATMTLENGISATVAKQLSALEAAEIPVDVFPESGAFAAGVAQDVWVVALSAPDKRGGLTVQALPDGPRVKTTREGIAKLAVPATVKDAWGNFPSTKILVYAEDGSEGHAELAPLRDALVVRADRDAYASGDEAKIRILGAGAGDRIALRLTRGDEPLATATCAVENAATGCEARAAVPPNASGLVWIHAVSMPKSGEAVKSGRRLVLVGARDRDLILDVKPSQSVFLPRETGTVGVAVTTSAGKPIQAELGAAVVDEAVFQLAQVRPDVEKAFFTVDKDLADARAPAYGGWSGLHSPPPSREVASLPAGWEARRAYDPASSEDLRGAILSVLTTTPPRGGIDDASSSALDLRATRVLEEARRRLGAWTVLFLCALAWTSLAGFCLYGIRRFLDARPPAASAEELDAFRRETRGLVFDWILGLFAPPLLGLLALALAEALSDHRVWFETALGAWAVVTLVATLALARSVGRVRNTEIGKAATALRRVLVFLPPAMLCGHLGVIFAVGDDGDLVGALLPGKTVVLVPILMAGAAQIASGMLSLVRHTMLGEVSVRRRVWLVLGRASFLGLPVTLVLLVLVGIHERARLQELSWDEYVESQSRRSHGAPGGDDYKEGGTGARAKGEEGSMGNPSPAAAAPLRAMSDRQLSSLVAPGHRAEPMPTREDFPETLLWVPSLVTDAAGRAEIKVPFADSITTWRFGLTAVGGGGQLGSATVPLVVKQDFFVDASTPPVLTQGDQVTVPVTVFNYLDRPQDVALALEGDGLALTAAGGTRVSLGPKEARGVRVTVRAVKAGERTMTIRAAGAARADAIARRIEVTPNGFRVVRTTNGLLAAARASTTTTEIPAAAIDGGSDLYVKVYGGPLSQVSESLDGVFTMPHGCFEQTSSTTYPSVLALDFLRRTRGSSPELEAKARRYIAEGYQRILSFEVSGGGFSLFGGSDVATTPLTAYGAMELADMAKVAPVDEQLLSRTREWLHRNRSGAGGWRRSSKSDKDDVALTAYVAWALAAGDAADARLGSVLDLVERASGKEATEPYALVLRANALLAGGRAAAAAPLLERLTTLAVRDEGGVHWSSSDVGVLYSFGASMDVEVTALATHALAVAGRDAELRVGALGWLVARRNGQGTWSTTQATIAALRALLDEARPAPTEAQDVVVTMDGTAVETLHLEPKARDVHRLTSLRRFATTGKHVLGIEASGTADIGFQLVAVHYLDWQRRSATREGLAIDVAYTPNAVPTAGTTSCHVHVAWRGAEPARMPLVEVAVPPAFEAETSGLDAVVGSRTSPVKRYTVERGKVSLYLADLPSGSPLDLDLPLRALHPARVTTLPSTVYLYYEPEVRAETAPTVLRAM